MMLRGAELTVALATEHVALADVRGALSVDLVVRKLRALDAALRQDWTAWVRAWQQVDATHCAALLALLARGTPVRLTLCGEQAAQTFEGMPQGFWQRVSRIFGTTPAWNKLSSL